MLLIVKNTWEQLDAQVLKSTWLYFWMQSTYAFRLLSMTLSDKHMESLKQY